MALFEINQAIKKCNWTSIMNFSGILKSEDDFSNRIYHIKVIKVNEHLKICDRLCKFVSSKIIPAILTGPVGWLILGTTVKQAI